MNRGFEVLKSKQSIATNTNTVDIKTVSKIFPGESITPKAGDKTDFRHIMDEMPHLIECDSEMGPDREGQVQRQAEYLMPALYGMIKGKHTIMQVGKSQVKPLHSEINSLSTRQVI